jgi:Raf kinase inhibitor-like YbhB/YbcL family protein
VQTQSLASVIDDPDPVGGLYVHWVVTGIPPSTTEIADGALPPGALVRANSEGKAAYLGPCPPAGTGVHHYRFQLYALGQDIGVGADNTGGTSHPDVAGHGLLGDVESLHLGLPAVIAPHRGGIDVTSGVGDQRAVIARMQNAGVRHCGPARAFGSTPDEKLDPIKSAAVKKAYADVLAGRSIYSITQDWNAQGFTSARGKAWTQAAERVVLLNPRNAGLRSHNGEIVGKAVWPAIVDRDTYDGTVALLTNPSRRVGGARGRKYLLSGLAVCGKCGNPLGSLMPARQRNQSRQARYHCKKCNGVTRKVESVDKFVLDVVAERLSR